MEKTIHLNVKTVPAFDAVAQSPHTAYIVFRKQYDELTLASGWKYRLQNFTLWLQ